jgi:hypothetical protein
MLTVMDLNTSLWVRQAGIRPGVCSTKARHSYSFADTRIEGSQLEAFFGNSVSDAGDVNRDGYIDIIVGGSVVVAWNG